MGHSYVMLHPCHRWWCHQRFFRTPIILQNHRPFVCYNAPLWKTNHRVLANTWNTQRVSERWFVVDSVVHHTLVIALSCIWDCENLCFLCCDVTNCSAGVGDWNSFLRTYLLSLDRSMHSLISSVHFLRVTTSYLRTPCRGLCHWSYNVLLQ